MITIAAELLCLYRLLLLTALHVVRLLCTSVRRGRALDGRPRPARAQQQHTYAQQ